MLAIDCGNTNIKWALFAADDRAPRVLQSGAFATTQINHALPLLVANMAQGAGGSGAAPPRKIFVANVAGAKVTGALKCAFSNHAATLTFVESLPQACGVRNGYAQPHTLGVDRFAALIAAHQQAQNQLVVMAGTALTIDALTDAGEFLGGLIVPGLRTMQQSLHQGTAHLPQISDDSALIYALPTSTHAAIASGAMQACVGAVALQAHTFAQALRATDKKLTRIVIAGGGAAAMLPQLKTAIAAIFDDNEHPAPAIELRPNLVLEGLYCLSAAAVNNEESQPSV